LIIDNFTEKTAENAENAEIAEIYQRKIRINLRGSAALNRNSDRIYRINRIL